MDPNQTKKAELPPDYDEAVGGAPPESSLIATAAPAPNEIGFRVFCGTVTPYPHFNVKQDVEGIHNAVTKKDEDMMIQIMCRRSMDQRLEIAHLYKETYEKPLARQIKDSIGKGHFAILTSALTMPIHESMARAVHNTRQYFSWMCYIMFILPNQLRHQMGVYFVTKYKVEIHKFVKNKVRAQNNNNTDKIYLTQILRVLESARDETGLINERDLQVDVKKCLDVANNSELKDEIKFMFFTKSFVYIRALCQEYLKQSGGLPIHSVIEAVFTNNQFVLLNIINFSINPVQYFVNTLKLFTGRFWFKKKILNSIILLRSELDMMEIKNEFERVYKISLQERVRKRASGYYKYALYELLGEQRSDKN